MSEAVIICQKENTLVSSTLKRTLDTKQIRDVQLQVKNGQMTPRY